MPKKTNESNEESTIVKSDGQEVVGEEVLAISQPSTETTVKISGVDIADSIKDITDSIKGCVENAIQPLIEASEKSESDRVEIKKQDVEKAKTARIEKILTFAGAFLAIAFSGFAIWLRFNGHINRWLYLFEQLSTIAISSVVLIFILSRMFRKSNKKNNQEAQTET